MQEEGLPPGSQSQGSQRYTLPASKGKFGEREETNWEIVHMYFFL